MIIHLLIKHIESSIITQMPVIEFCKNHSTLNSASLLLCIKNKLKERYEQFWEQRMKSDEKMSKLRTCMLIKNKFGIEKYLELNKRNLKIINSF